jgi:ABC-type transporter MlaC component
MWSRQSCLAAGLSSKNSLKLPPILVREVVEQELMPYVDYRYAAFKILGKIYVTPANRKGMNLP